jgi:hypothetical protein
MNPRQPDGTFRGAKQPASFSEAYLKARWQEAEALALKKKWVSYEDIATHIVRVARGDEKPVKPLPEGLQFKPGFSISKQAVQKAVTKALARERALNVEEFRQLANAQSEECLMYLQAAIRKGDPQAISTTMKVMGFMAKLNGAHSIAGNVDAANKVATSPLTTLLAEIGPIDDDEQEKKAG